ncbi:MAG: 1-deoxy-D-xylulose 5-phosphate reductoisomerase [Opitutia bacterium UBA7350]|nr:MAG: 1-deoxy-D-xylulose 5-phosphate reductoisomerase [Opitutae bacterium UBA7350]
MTDCIRKKIVLLGATGSIGSNTLQVLRAHPDQLELIGVSAQSNDRKLAEICSEFKVPYAVLTDEKAYEKAQAEKVFDSSTRLAGGNDALSELAGLPEADLVLVAVVGACGLQPTLAAIEAGKDIALANKEALVLGGAFVMERAREKGIRLLPTDSEHNAIFQCLEAQPTTQLDRIILTASGGPFRDTPLAELEKVTPSDAVQHPNWSMGHKISVDSATMANKGLELIEAHWLFGLPPEQLQVVIHPQSIAHSFVQFIDGSILAQMSPPSMTFPIQHCLLYPERAPAVEPTLDFQQAFQLEFCPPDPQRFPCLVLAYDSLRNGGGAPAVFNAANEIAVGRFLSNELSYPAIPHLIEAVLEQLAARSVPDMDSLLALDAEARQRAHDFKL